MLANAFKHPPSQNGVICKKLAPSMDLLNDKSLLLIWVCCAMRYNKPKNNNALIDEGVVVCKESDDDLLSHG